MWPELTVRLIGAAPENNWWLPLLSALAGGALALGGSLATTFGLEWWKGKRATRQMAIAISSEVESTARMLRFRNAVEGLRLAMAETAKGNITLWAFKIGDDYLPVSRSAMSNVGAFRGDVPYLLAELLTLARSAKMDLDDIRDPTGSLAGVEDAQVVFSRYWQLVVILDHAMETSQKLVGEIAKQYRLPIRRPWDPTPAPTAAEVVAADEH